MRLVSYQSDSGPRVAGVRGDELVDLNHADATLPAEMASLLALGSEGLQRAANATAKGRGFERASVRPTAPVPRPRKIICVGLNYADHARETGKQPPAEPVMFCKLTSAVNAHERPIVLPPVSREVDFEAELVVVIGREGRHIPAVDALQYVAGYCCGNDVSARDWQLRKPGGQWLLGKSFDTFAPFGPQLVTRDEVGDPGRLHIESRLNGQVMQSSNTNQLIFPVHVLISYVSDVCTLLPGDLLFTGTPNGVGVARQPPVFLKPGDVIEVEIEKLGLLRNPVVDEAAQR